MEERIARFVAGLRASGVRVSVAESGDAWRAITHLGVRDREPFRLALRATLVKDQSDLDTFDELFPMYFGVGVPPLLNPAAELSPEEQDLLQQALEELAGDLSALMQWLLNGNPPSEQELRELAERAGIDSADSRQQARWYARRMQRLLGWDRLPQLLEMLWEWLAEHGMDPQTIAEMQAQVAQNMDGVREQLEQVAGREIHENQVEEYHEQRQNAHDLMNRPFSALSETEMDVLRDQVRRLAARLRSRAALRQKRGKEGKLDAKGTLRASLKYGGVPVELRLRKRRLKPRLVVFLDVSTSMRPVAEFFLRMLYELGDQVQKTTSFAFIDHLEDVSHEMKTLRPDQAVESVLTRLPAGYYNTDLGRSLRQFAADHLGTLDHRTTVIVLGDGRNNYRNPGLDAFDTIRRRSRRLIWLNPEFPAQWGSGDSDMLLYAPLCSEVFTVRNLKQLADAVDAMLG